MVAQRETGEEGKISSSTRSVEEKQQACGLFDKHPPTHQVDGHGSQLLEQPPLTIFQKPRFVDTGGDISLEVHGGGGFGLDF